ncbi:MAG: hypothetical protein KDI82_02655 [Gammaproteobacteria bacterium]|nr:hypothetical protein [Gammaproteobacteria bacterium]
MADDLYRLSRTLDGFVSATYRVSEDEREYSSVMLWDSKQAAVDAGDAIRAKSATMLETLVTAPPSVVINEVYELQSWFQSVCSVSTNADPSMLFQQAAFNSTSGDS